MAEENLHHNTLVDKIPHKPSLKTRPSHFLFLKNGVGIFPAQNRTVGFALLKWSSIYTSSSMLLALMTSCRNTAGLQEQTLLLGKMHTSIFFFFFKCTWCIEILIFISCVQGKTTTINWEEQPHCHWENCTQWCETNSVWDPSINKPHKKIKSSQEARFILKLRAENARKLSVYTQKKILRTSCPSSVFSNAIFNRVTQGWFPEGKPAYSKYLCSLITNVTLPVITHGARS